MGFNLVEAVSVHVTPNAVSKIAESTGESPDKTRSAIGTGVLAIASSIIRRGLSRAGALGILSTLQSFGSGTISRAGLASGLLGDEAEQNDLTDTVARLSGVNRGATSNILASLLPITAGVLGREIGSRRLDADGVSNLLASQKANLTGHPSLSSSSSSGLGPRMGSGTIERERDVRRVSDTQGVPVAPPSKPRRNWLPITVLMLGALALLLLLVARKPTGGLEVKMPRLGKPNVEAPATQERTGQTKVTGAEIKKPAATTTAATADDVTAHFIGTGQLPERFALSGVNFNFGTTEMTDGADSLDRVAAALVEHPSARVRIEGHTDSVGDPSTNSMLSFQRAAVVRQKLIDRGADPARIEVTGKRELDAVATNDKEEGRALNRRVDIVILSR